jgi:sugar phosphate isomerase/epimerase
VIPTALRFAYGSNGLGDHRLADACALLAEEGYAGIALTLDHQHLDPAAADLDRRVAEVAALLDAHGLAVVVETGGRFVLDPRRKHHPTLVSADGADRRIAFYRRALDVAAALGSPVLHLWSGVAAPEEDPDAVQDRLLAGLEAVLVDAAAVGVPLALEPEPGMAVDTIAAFERVAAALGDPDHLRMTLDVGHCRCIEAEDEAACVRRVADRLGHVQIEDMRRGVHEHLPFGEGEIDFPPVLAALAGIGYDGLVSVELTRHAHTAHTMVPAAIRFLTEAARTAEAA